jgi:acetolactate synthase regulatory subunit
MTYTLDIILNEEQSTLTKIITTLRKLQFNLELFHMEKEPTDTNAFIQAELTGERSIELLEKSLKKIEGVQEVCNTTQ